MKYRDILGFSKSKKKVIKEQSKPKKNKIIENVKQELNEWHHQPPTEKRWSKKFNGNQGLTEFEQRGGKDNVNEGPAGEYAKAYSNVKSTFSDFWDAVGDFQLLLKQKGLRKHQVALKKEWLRVEKFYKFFFKMMDKLQ